MQVRSALRLMPDQKLPEIAAVSDRSDRHPNRKLAKSPLYRDAIGSSLQQHDPKGLTAIKYTEPPGTRFDGRVR